MRELQEEIDDDKNNDKRGPSSNAFNTTVINAMDNTKNHVPTGHAERAHMEVRLLHGHAQALRAACIFDTICKCEGPVSLTKNT